ncbi:MAG: TonB-dependent receptor [Chitinophagaceae bacterium]|nr:TonB-dependent receptor [Chitinophagaceae bacterium]
MKRQLMNAQRPFAMKIIASLLLASLFVLTTQAQDSGKPATGVITNQKGEPLFGVTVAVSGTKVFTQTDALGKFSVQTPGASATLDISYVGYQKRSITVTGGSETRVVMSETTGGLNDVVVVGYTTQKRKDLTGALSVIDARDIHDIPVGGVDQILQGKAPGVTVTSSTGAPGGPIEVRIRGIGTTGDNNPLYIVDGVPTKDGINEISPNDVESITVLKDAASASIYGSRSANGVVLITTKKGRSGVPRLSLNAYTGVQTPAHLIKMANTQEYVNAFNAAAANDGRAPIPKGMIDTLPDVNWLKETLRPAPLTNVQFSVSGGSPNTTYSLSAAYFTQKGMIMNSANDRANIHAAIISNLSKIVTIGTNLNLAYNKYRQVGSSGDGYGTGNPGASIVRYALFRTPATPVFNKDGSYVDLPNPASLFGDGYNPVGLAANTNTNYYNYSLLGDLYLAITPVKNLTIKTDLGTNAIITDYKQFNPTWGTRSINATGSLGQSNTDNFSYNWTNTATYNWEKDKHALSLLAGTELIYNDTKALSGSQQNYPNQSPAFQYLNNGIGTSLLPSGIVGGNESRWALFSLLGRIGYTYDDKYLASVSFRRDGSSKLQSSNRYGNFFSGSLGWRIDREAFMRDVSQVSLLKIRGSVGQLGNQEIGNYAYTSTVGPTGNYSFGGKPAPGYTILSNGNANIFWEKSTQKDIGIDLGLFQNAVTFTADYYNKTTTGMLLSVPVPSSAGSAGSPTENAGKVQNSGFEFEAGYRKSINRDLRFSINANFATVKNKVVSLAGGKPIPGGRIDDNIFATLTTEGQPIGAFYMLRQEGIFQNDHDVFTHAYQGPGVQAGDVKYLDVNHDGFIDEKDRQFAGSPIPKFTYGFTGAVNYKNFDLSLFFQGVYGNKIYDQVLTDIEGFYRAFNVTERIANQSWHGEGTSNSFPRLSWTNAQNNKRSSTRFLEDGSYVRLKNVQLGYNLGGILNRHWVSSARVFVSVQNAFTITRYTGLDPEMGVNSNSTGDGVRAVGIDWGTYPSARTFTAGVNLNF